MIASSNIILFGLAQKSAQNFNLFTSAASTIATVAEVAVTRASSISNVDKEMLVNLIKEEIEVINDKNKKFCAVNKKAVAWLEILRKFNDLTGNKKTPQQVRKI